MRETAGQRTALQPIACVDHLRETSPVALEHPRRERCLQVVRQIELIGGVLDRLEPLGVLVERGDELLHALEGASCLGARSISSFTR